ncbi:MAG: type II toxin-antitoxin system HigB family toxin [Bryobacteraceae bacterium]
MRVISRKALRDASRRHRDTEEPLDAWFRIAKAANWANLQDVRSVYSHAGQVGDCTVFNVKGNGYRLIVRFRFQHRRVYILRVLTHAEYDKGAWKNECD